MGLREGGGGGVSALTPILLKISGGSEGGSNGAWAVLQVAIKIGDAGTELTGEGKVEQGVEPEEGGFSSRSATDGVAWIV